MDAVITSSSNPLIKRIRALHRARGRRLAGLTLLEGPIAFSQMVSAGVPPETVLVVEDDADTMAQCREFGWSPVAVSEEVLVSASDTVHPQSPIAIIRVPEPRAIRDRDTLVLVDVSDPGNVGTMIRSAAAFGWDVCISGETADPWGPKVLRAGAGSHFEVYLASSSDPVADSHACGLVTMASVVDGGGLPEGGDRPIALMIGSEAHGLAEELTTSADEAVTLSMSGQVESLNAAVAASILMYLLR